MAVTLPEGITRETAIKLLIESGMTPEAAAQFITKPGGTATATQYAGLEEALKAYQSPAGYRTSTEPWKMSVELPDLSAGMPPVEIPLRQEPPSVSGVGIGAGAGITIPVTGVETSFVTIPATAEELTLDEKNRQSGCAVYKILHTYKVAVRGGESITVEAFDKESAKTKARDNGYRVEFATQMGPKGMPPTKKERPLEEKEGSVTLQDGSVATKIPNVDSLDAYRVTLQDGSSVDYVEIKDEMGGDPILVPKTDWEAFPQEYKSLAQEKGWRAVDTAIYQDRQESQWEFERQLATEPDYLQEAYRTGGIDGYNRAVDDWNRVIDWVEQRRYELWPANYPEELKEPTVRNRSPEIYDLWVKMNKPSDMSAEAYGRIVPYLSPRQGGAGDLTGAIEAGVPDSTITKVMGLSNEELGQAKWNVEFQDAGFFDQQKMLIDKDPVEYTKAVGKAIGEAAITMIPAYGTAYMAQHPDKYATWEVGLGAASDALILVAGVGLVSKLVKAGSSISRAVARVGFEVVRGTVTTPWAVLRHPLQTAKGLGMLVVSPLEMLFKAKTLPIASVWRGTYEDGFSIAKVLAGSPNEALETQKAMAKQFQLITEGKASSGVVDIKGFGELKFSATGFQEGVPNITFHATPFGAQFKGAGIQIGKEGLYTADQALLGLDQSSATGQSMIYVFRKNELLGMIDDTGKLLDNAGIVKGQLRIGEKLTDLKGNTIFRFSKNGQVVDKAGAVVGQIKTGGVWTEDGALIGKYYKGVNEYVDGSLGIINKEGMVEDATGEILGKAKGKLIGYIPEGVKVVGMDNIVVGKTKLQPAFVLIQTHGVSALPESATKAKSMTELESLAWAAFKEGSQTDELYPVFKQYAKWIEDEGFLTKDTRLIPVLDKNGKPLMLATRDIGRKIEMPVMQIVSKDWFEKSLELTRQLAKYPVMLDDSVDVVKILEKGVTKVPKRAIEGIVGWLRQTRDAVLIGGGSEVVFTKGKLTTADFDIAVPKPTKAMGDELAHIINMLTDKSTRATVTSKGVIVEWLDKGLWRKAVDLDPLDWIKEKPPLGLAEFEYVPVGGINVQTPASQMTRLFWYRMVDDFGGKGYQKWARYAQALGADVDIGIGAKAPSTLTLRKLQVEGLWNTLRDIFVPTLEKRTWLRGIEQIAPDLAPDAKKLMNAEERVEDLLRQFRSAERARTVASQKTMARLVPLLQDAQDEVNRLTMGLRDNLLRRAVIINSTMKRMGKVDADRLQRSIEQTYRAMSGEPRGERISVSGIREELRRPTLEERQVRVVSERVVRKERGKQTKPPERYYSREERQDRYERHQRYQRQTRYERRPPREWPRKQYPKQEKIEETKEDKKRSGVPEGSIAFAMGKLKRKTGLKPQWYYIPPPWTQEVPISLSYPPLGAKYAEETTPEKTIQMIGEPKAKVPKSVSIDLGVVDILISDYGQKISFTGHGEETKVGKSLNIPTRGMSIPATAPMRVARKRGNGHKVARKSERVVA